MKKIFLLLIIHLFTSIQLKAQLSGTYTIGGITPDYPTISSAVSDLIALGTSSPVVFNIRNGIYHDSIKITYLPTTTSHNSVTFQSESGDSALVKLLPNCYSNQTFPFHIIEFPSGGGVDTLILKNISIIDTCSNSQPIFCSGYASFIFDKIKVVGLIYIFPPNIKITNSTIDGVFQCTSNQCITTIKNSHFLLTNPPAGFGSIPFTFGYGLFSNNTFDGSIMFSGAAYGSINFLNNICDSTSIICDYGNNHNFINNKFYNSNISLDGSTTNPMLNLKFINNELHGSLGMVSCNNAKIYQNKIYKGISLVWSTNCEYFNNFFFLDTIVTGSNTQVNLAGSDGNKIYNNTFSPEVILRASNYAGNDYKNNIIPKNIWELNYTDIFTNNDYAGWPVPWDSHPYNIYPNFIDTLTDLHSRNFQLIGKGVYIPSNNVDIDSLSRNNPPTIGANEICFSSSDSITLACGDSLSLALCSVFNNHNVVWFPLTGLNFSLNNFPKASPPVTTTYIATDTLTGFSDSIKIKIVPYNVKAFKDTLIYCGDSILLDATMNAGAVFNWSPSIGLSNTNVQRPFAKPTTTTTYTLTATTICGVSSDTITISVNPLPRAYFYLNSTSGLTIGLLNVSTCADNYLWNLGDGDTSSVTNPTHTYLNSGMYTVTLIACNSFGCDTISFTVYVSNTGITELAKNNIRIYPNPTSGQFTISLQSDNAIISVTDLLGQQILKTQTIQKTTNLQLDNNGVYIVYVTTKQGTTTRKLIVNR